MLFRKWRERRAEKKAYEEAIGAIYEQILSHIVDGGQLEDFLTVPLFEEVEWDKGRQSWFIRVLENGESWTNGSSVIDGKKLDKGQRVSLMSGRGGRVEDAVVVSGRKVSVNGVNGYIYILDFTETGGAQPWFTPLMGE